MRVDAFDFDLPGDRIALRPAGSRDRSRLLVVDPGSDPPWTDLGFQDLPDLLRAGDVAVFNDTKVIPARLHGHRTGRSGTTPKIEVTLHQRIDAHRWRAFAKPARKLDLGDTVSFGSVVDVCSAGAFSAVVMEKGDGGEVVLGFEQSGPVLDEAIATHGAMPLPPYIASRRAADERDDTDYQTVYARTAGAVAAPTAGLHFTDDLLARLDNAGIERAMVTLHVGAGTFLPVRVESTEEHKMHAEWGEVSEAAADVVNAARARGGRVVCVGTTSLRLLESACGADGRLQPFAGRTDIFITPGYRFKIADMLLTNFHLPRSTLFMLVCAFSGTGCMKDAYQHAIADGYRFYSYGDASLLTRAATE